MDATWAEDFLDLNQFAAAKSLDNVVYNESLLMLGREKQQQRAEIINRSALGIRVILWDEAERLAREFVVLILEIVGAGYVFYVGTTVHKQNTAGYCNEALACLLDKKRRPVLFPKDSDRFSMTQVLNDLGFQVLHLTHRSQ